MNIDIQFARLLLQADELALSKQHDRALEVYARLARLDGLSPAETALVSARLEMLRGLVEPAAGSVEVVQRSEEQPAPSPEAEAEGRVNQGDLPGAIALYQELVAADPSHDLARERLAELRAQADIKGGATTGPSLSSADLSGSTARPSSSTTTEDWRASLPADPVAMLEELLARVESHRRVA